jgi:hypothetical protein
MGCRRVAIDGEVFFFCKIIVDVGCLVACR